MGKAVPDEIFVLGFEPDLSSFPCVDMTPFSLGVGTGLGEELCRLDWMGRTPLVGDLIERRFVFFFLPNRAFFAAIRRPLLGIY